MHFPEYHRELQRAYVLLRKLFQQGQAPVWTQVIEFLEGIESLAEEERGKRAADEAWLRRQLDCLSPMANIRGGVEGNEQPKQLAVPIETGEGDRLGQPLRDELSDLPEGLPRVPTPEALTARVWRALRFPGKLRWLRGRVGALKRGLDTPVSVVPAPVVAGPMELGYIPEMLGPWDVKYPTPEGMPRKDHAERLVLMPDGTYTWTPAPEWARPEGHWGIRKEPDLNDALVLCFETKEGLLRCHFLVLIRWPDGRTGWHWQHKVVSLRQPDGREEIAPNVVSLNDLILLGDRPKC